MTDLEVAITNIGELAARKTKDFFEEETGSKVVSKTNLLNYQYVDENNLIGKE